MKKLFCAVLIVCLLLCALPASAAAAQVVFSPQALSVDGVTHECEAYRIDGSDYFKLRDLAYLLNGTPVQFGVGWDAASNSVTITRGIPYEPNGAELVVGPDRSAEAVPSPQRLSIGSAVPDGLIVWNIGGSNFLRLIDLSTFLGFSSGFDEATNTAVVRSVFPQGAAFDALWQWTVDNATESYGGNPAFSKEELPVGEGSHIAYGLCVYPEEETGGRLGLLYQRLSPTGEMEQVTLMLERGRQRYGAYYAYGAPGNNGVNPDFLGYVIVDPARFTGGERVEFPNVSGPLAGTDAAADMDLRATCALCETILRFRELCQDDVTPRGAYGIEDFGFDTARLSTAELK